MEGSSGALSCTARSAGISRPPVQTRNSVCVWATVKSDVVCQKLCAAAVHELQSKIQHGSKIKR